VKTDRTISGLRFAELEEEDVVRELQGFHFYFELPQDPQEIPFAQIFELECRETVRDDAFPFGFGGRARTEESC
jgi:hypothetical protein